ncbi:PREDICTED: obscurin-like, partial [Tinamus guttatus]|uniref:obscurin-like n=1 Tax=Tinamus guttatus TaxID=94827 RepID=UPI00052ECF48
VEEKDAGEYTCEAAGQKLTFRINVTEPKPVFINLEKVEKEVHAVLTEKATLSCEVAEDATDVKWYKDGKLLASSKNFKIESLGKTRHLHIEHLDKKDAGEYTCEAAGEKLTFKIVPTAPRVVKFVTSLNNTVSEEGKEAVFKCTVSPSDAVVTWHRNGAKIEASKKYVISQKDANHSLTITDLTMEDAAEISAVAEGVESSAKLRVREAPVSFKKKLEPKTVEERDTVTLEVELTKPAEVKWMRNKIELKPSEKIEIKDEGTKHILVIKNISFAERGFYCCESPDDKTQAKINVEMRKITLVKGLQPVEVCEKGTATFEVEVSHEGVEGIWQRDGVRLKPSPNVRIDVVGKKHLLTLSSLTLEDAGLISFKANGTHSSGTLDVTELPVRISKPLSNMTITQKDKVTFECELSRPNVDVKWFKDGKQLQQNKNIKIVSQGTMRSLTIQKCEYEDQGTYVCEAASDKTSATLKVH